MVDHARDLQLGASKLIQANAFGEGVGIWKCKTHTQGGIGFWVGYKSGTSIELYSYLALFHRDLGGHQVLEGKKAWTEPMWRRKGLGRALLRTAAAVAPLLTDTDGMTESAYHLWYTEPGLSRQWWDTQDSCFADDSAVPATDRFDHFDSASRWQLLLTLSQEQSSSR
ncbi:MAG: hypothetical protein IH617_13285 [Hydrogenophaga sp.]|nr:hypothetical protein [Hydrogenophaga sp.]